MPPRGNKPKPSGLHLVTGTFRKDRHGDEIVQPAGDLPNPPTHLSDLARGFWEALAIELKLLGLGFPCEQWDLEHVSLLYSRARDAESLMPKGGFYADDDGNPRRHPAAIEALACRKELRVALESMGVSATGRARLLGNAKHRGSSADAADEFFGGRRANKRKAQ